MAMMPLKELVRPAVCGRFDWPHPYGWQRDTVTQSLQNFDHSRMTEGTGSVERRAIVQGRKNVVQRQLESFAVNRTGFIGGLFLREDGAHVPKEQVRPGTA